MKAVGFKNEVKLVENDKCPICKMPIHSVDDFTDELSVAEYRISGMCQKCQDSIFRDPMEWKI